MYKELRRIRINTVSENRMDQLIVFYYGQLKFYCVAKICQHMFLGNLDIHMLKNRAVFSPYTTLQMDVRVLSTKTEYICANRKLAVR